MINLTLTPQQELIFILIIGTSPVWGIFLITCAVIIYEMTICNVIRQIEKRRQDKKPKRCPHYEDESYMEFVDQYSINPHTGEKCEPTLVHACKLCKTMRWRKFG